MYQGCVSVSLLCRFSVVPFHLYDDYLILHCVQRGSSTGGSLVALQCVLSLHHVVLTLVKLLLASQIKGEHGVCGLEVEECVCVSRGPQMVQILLLQRYATNMTDRVTRTHFDQQTSAYSDITIDT